MMKLLSYGNPYYKKDCACGCGTCDESKKVVTVGALPEDPDRVRRPAPMVGAAIAVAAFAGFGLLIKRK
jgi:hypothetical protein